MIKVATFMAEPYLAHGVNASSPKGKRGLEIEQLRANIKSLQSRMSGVRDQTNRLRAEQAEMQKSLVRIDRKVDDQRLSVKKEEKRHEALQQAAKLIVDDHASVALSLDAAFLLWKQLSPLPAAIQMDQAKVKAQFNVVLRNNQAMQQQALAIQNHGIVIRQNLLEAAQKVDHMRQEAQQVKLALDAIAAKDAEIVETKGIIEQQVQELEALQREVPVAEQEDVVVPQQTLGFWSQLVQKIITYVAWMFNTIASSLVGEGVDMKKWLVSQHLYSFSDAINHPATWVIVGAVACAVVRNVMFSLACLAVECTLFYYRWRKAQMNHQEV